MRAMQAVATVKGLSLEAVVRSTPKPERGELLIRILAVGVTPTELQWFPTTHNKDGSPRMGAVPGHEFSGTIAEVGHDVHGFQTGDQVFGMNDWFADGATAEFCLTVPSAVALKPAALSHEQAATVPISALTAWQGLITRAKIKAGERVLIHGGSGSVGGFAVQLAALHGAHVTTTATQDSYQHLKQLGASEVIDYKKDRFEDRAAAMDVVFDTVGGDTLARSWAILGSAGRLVTIAADVEASGDERAKQAFFIVEPSGSQLANIAQLLQSGKLRTWVKAVVPLEQATSAYAQTLAIQGAWGKVVIGPQLSC